MDKAKLLSITLWSAYDHIKLFCGLMLNYSLVVCGMPNIIKLSYFLAYKERFGIQFYWCIWYGLSVKCVFGMYIHLHQKI